MAPGKPVVLKSGCSETDFEFADDGALIAVCRNELGDADGFGSKICRAEKDNLGDWRCERDFKKYDSPLVFKHGSKIYLVGRRNLNKSGNFDLKKGEITDRKKAITFAADYWKQPKRCSLWEVHPEKLKVRFIADLPSKGDTCFPSVIQEFGGHDRNSPCNSGSCPRNSYMLYNYTSPVDGPDVSWNQGQLGHTLIYRILLTFPEQQ